MIFISRFSGKNWHISRIPERLYLPDSRHILNRFTDSRLKEWQFPISRITLTPPSSKFRLRGAVGLVPGSGAIHILSIPWPSAREWGKRAVECLWRQYTPMAKIKQAFYSEKSQSATLAPQEPKNAFALNPSRKPFRRFCTLRTMEHVKGLHHTDSAKLTNGFRPGKTE